VWPQQSLRPHRSRSQNQNRKWSRRSPRKRGMSRQRARGRSRRQKMDGPVRTNQRRWWRSRRRRPRQRPRKRRRRRGQRALHWRKWRPGSRSGIDLRKSSGLWNGCGRPSVRSWATSTRARRSFWTTSGAPTCRMARRAGSRSRSAQRTWCAGSLLARRLPACGVLAVCLPRECRVVMCWQFACRECRVVVGVLAVCLPRMPACGWCAGSLLAPRMPACGVLAVCLPRECRLVHRSASAMCLHGQHGQRQPRRPADTI